MLKFLKLFEITTVLLFLSAFV